MKPHPRCRSLRYRRHSPARTRLHRRRITVRHTGSRSRHNRTERSLLSIRGTVSVRHTNRDCDVIRSRQRGANSVLDANPRQLECGSCFDHWLDTRFLRLLCRRDGADQIAKDFGRTNAEVALTITITLAFRPLGAFLFGLMADRYGRRKPLMIDVVAFSILWLR